MVQWLEFSPPTSEAAGWNVSFIGRDFLQVFLCFEVLGHIIREI